MTGSGHHALGSQQFGWLFLGEQLPLPWLLEVCFAEKIEPWISFLALGQAQSFGQPPLTQGAASGEMQGWSRRASAIVHL